MKRQDIEQQREEMDAYAKEAIAHIYAAILKTPEFTLNNGIKCKVEALSEPEVDSDGKLTCGIDVIMDNAGHLEFTVANTGWGKSFITDLVKNAVKQARGRGKP